MSFGTLSSSTSKFSNIEISIIQNLIELPEYILVKKVD
jgi:hypothetical protein